ncbi:MAG: leucyl aminopeptidase family protein [Saprospiraceae bacterium]
MDFTIIADVPANAQAILYPFTPAQWDTFTKSNAEGLGGVPSAALRNVFTGESKSCLSTFDANGRQIHLIGLGSKVDFGQYLKVFRSYFYQRRLTLPLQIAIDLRHLADDISTEVVEAMANGIQLSSYSIQLYKTKKEGNNSAQSAEKKIVIVSSRLEDHLQEAAEIGKQMALTQQRILDLVNAPSNKKSPTSIGQWAIESGKQNGFHARILAKSDLEKEGLSALLAVSKGSVASPILLLMEYQGDPGTEVYHYGLVGKGVIFDTGGISMKSSTNMHFMKSDMGGAAAVLGAFEMIAKQKLKINVVAAIPLTENSVDGDSVKPGDVIGSYLGKSIEVIDTDAEGRLILADGLAYLVKNYQPKVLINAATLTGSIIQTLGYQAAGMFTANDALAKQIFEAGMSCGERVWRLPLWDAYQDDLQSDIADLKNYSGKPIAGAITAAKFLEEFTDSHTSWAHLDIAGVAFADSEYSTMRAATAYGVRLFYNLIKG